MTREDFQRFVETHEWRFAKTLAHNPHFYTLRAKTDYNLFASAVEFIRENAFKFQFGKTWYSCYNLDGWRYWSMGAPVRDTILINRQKIKPVTPYDEIADNYDRRFSTDEDLKENETIMQMMGVLRGSVLDVGSGTGLLLDYKIIEHYTGVEISQLMIQEFQRKHSRKLVICTSFEKLSSKVKADNVIALFSASYINDLSLFEKHWTGNGMMFLVFFSDHYTPKAHQGMTSRNWTYPTRAEIEQKFGACIPFGENYLIVKKTR